MRGFWNPTTKAFYSRLGNKLPLPDEVVEAMPSDIFLDGELWYIHDLGQILKRTSDGSIFLLRFGRDNFQEAMKISNRVDPKQIDWSRFKYMVFDIPQHPGTYEERYLALSTYCLFHNDSFRIYPDLTTSSTKR